jgi:hypothetical protein
MTSHKGRWFAGLAAALVSAGCGELPPAQSQFPPAVASVTVSPGAPSILAGTTTQLVATTKDAQGNILGSRVITWSSSAEAVATVSATGLVTGASAGGPVTITATSEGQYGTAQVTVTASEPAVATTLAAITNLTSSGFVGAAVLPPSVRVTDQRGAFMIGVTVTFAVASGGGSVTGGSVATNSAGVATVGTWILGATPGPNTLTASVTGLPSVTFAATGTVNASPCFLVVMTHVSGTTTNGALDGADCVSDGVLIDQYSTTLGGVNAYLFRQSATFDTYLYLGTSPPGILNGGVIAENNDESSGTTNSAIKALLPAGSYVLGASSWEWGVTGAYSLSSGTTSIEVTGCEEVFIVRGVATSQNIQATDCLRKNGPVYADEFLIYLKAGQSLTLSMASTAVDSFLELVFGDPRTVVAFNDTDASGSKNARLVYFATASGYYRIIATTALIGQTGGYTLTIQ